MLEFVYKALWIEDPCRFVAVFAANMDRDSSFAHCFGCFFFSLRDVQRLQILIFTLVLCKYMREIIL